MTTPIVARLDGRCCNSAEEAGTESQDGVALSMAEGTASGFKASGPADLPLPPSATTGRVAEAVPVTEQNSHNANGPAAGLCAAESTKGLSVEVDRQECLKVRGGGVSENDAAPSLSQNRRVVLSYSGARVISAYTHIEIELTQAPGRHGLVGELRRGRWVRSAERIWSRENDVAAIASARDILGKFYGEPNEQANH